MSETTALDGSIPFYPNEESVEQLISQLCREFEVSCQESIRVGFRPVDSLAQERLNEWTQHLLDLEYLDEADAETDEYTDAILQAINTFSAETVTFSMDSVSDESLPTEDEYVNNIDVPVEGPGALELQRLADLTSFDGDISFPQAPLCGQQNLFTRVLHFRLKTLGLYHQSVADQFNEDTQKGLKILEFLVGSPPEDVATCDLLGDAVELSSRFLEKHGDEPLIFRSQRADMNAQADYSKLAIVEGDFVECNRWLRITQADRYRKAMKNIETRGSIESRILDIRNRFGLQLLQLRLWMLGFYKGRVDGWWGPLSQQALEEALDFEGISREDALLYLGNGYWAVNLDFIVKKLFDQLERAETSLEKYKEAIVQESIYLKEESQRRRKIFERIWQYIRGSFRKVIAAGRRIYHGAKTLFKSAAEGLMKGYNWIYGQLEKIAGPVVNFFKVFYRGIREGISLVAQSLPKFFHFVLHRPIITYDKSHQSFAVSRFDLDFDAILIVAENASTDLIQSHAQLCRNLAKWLRICLIIVARVFAYLTRIATGPLSWLQIAFQIGSILDDVVHARSVFSTAAAH